MPPPVLFNLEEVSLNIGLKTLFEDITLHIAQYDKICLVGKNGVGKTTLMKLITGDLEPDSGTRFFYPGLRVGYLAQSFEADPELTIKEFVLNDIPEEQSYLADIILEPLQIDPDAKMGNLSGGQRRRAGLARALIEEPDILLLDEPTNHLDLSAIEWLEGYLADYRGALLCVSHDRAFLKNISKKCFWLDRGRIRTLNNGYAAFEDWQATRLEQEARELQNMQKKLQSEVDWTQGGVTGRRKRNVRRMRELFALRDKLKNDKASYNQQIQKIDLDPLAPSQASKLVAEFKRVSHSYPRHPECSEGSLSATDDQADKKILHDVQDDKLVILDNFNYRIMKGDKIGVLGNNGSGKSTFLKLLVGELEQQQGHIRRSKTLEVSYFDQNRQVLNPKDTVWKTLAPEGGDYIYIGSGENRKARHVCGYLKDFLFDPKIARDPVGILSGGQQNRLLLSVVLANPGNLLILDEPTNDLDMDTLDMLQEILADYQGTLILVSHDRDFLDRTVGKVLAFEGDGHVQQHIGGYTDYLEAKKHGVKEDKYPVKETPVEKPAPQKVVQSNDALSFAEQHELEELPEKIESFEVKIKELQERFTDSQFYHKDPDGFDKANQQLELFKSALEKAEERWLELSTSSS